MALENFKAPISPPPPTPHLLEGVGVTPSGATVSDLAFRRACLGRRTKNDVLAPL